MSRFEYIPVGLLLLNVFQAFDLRRPFVSYAREMP